MQLQLCALDMQHLQKWGEHAVTVYSKTLCARCMDLVTRNSKVCEQCQNTCSAQHCTAQHSTARHGTAGHSRAQQGTAGHSRAQQGLWVHLDRAHAAALWHIGGYNLPEKHSQTVHISLQHNTKSITALWQMQMRITCIAHC